MTMNLLAYAGIGAIAFGILMVWSSTNRMAVGFWSTAVVTWSGERSPVAELIEGRLVIYGIGLLLLGVVLVFAT